MIVKVQKHDASKGGQFHETARYILAPESHETRAAIKDGLIDPATLGHRVAWATALNLDGVDRTPSGIAAAMHDIATRSNELKRAAGIKRTGRPPSGFSGEHIVMSWGKDETPSKAEMQTAALSMLKARGYDPDRHQIIMAAHNDTANAHLHLLVNRVSFVDGIRADCGKNDYARLQAWAADYERKQGKVQCPNRKQARSTHDLEPAAQDVDPARIEQTAAPSPKRPPAPSYAVKNALAQAKRAGIELDNLAKAEIAALAPVHAKEWGDLAAQKKIAGTVAQSLKDASFTQSKAEQKTAPARAKAEVTRGLMGWLLSKINDRADRMDWHQYKTVKTERWREFYRAEKKAPGASVRMLAQLAARRGMRVDRRALLTDRAARETLMKAIDLHERKQVYARQDRRRQPIKERAAQLVEQARADHKTRSKAIDKNTLTLHTERKKELAGKQRNQVNAILEAAQQRSIQARALVPDHDELKELRDAEYKRLKAQQKPRAAQEGSGNDRKASDKIPAADRKENPFAGVFDKQQQQDTGRERKPPGSGPGRI